MPKRYVLELSEAERAKLQSWVKNPPRPYLRTRARAMLLVAGHKTLSEVAADRHIHKDRKTIGNWVRRYQAFGLAGLKVVPGQGRKPGFSPSHTRGSASAGGKFATS